MRPDIRRRIRIIAVVCAVLAPSAVTRAQSLDPSFNPGANFAVLAMAVQPDGRILVGGAFTRLGGGGLGTTTRNHIGRLNADGSLDTSFNPGANGNIWAVAVQADGKILVGGHFTTLGGGGTGTTTRNRIGRLNADGSLDTSFDPGANDTVYAVAVQADGQILVSGYFTTLGGGGTGTTTRNYLGRLNADGSLDTSFNPGADNLVYAMAVQADGKIPVGGYFTTLGGGGTGTTTRNRIGRLNADGSLDTSFNPGANDYVHAVAVQADGKILVGGNFTTLGGGIGTTARNRIGRLNADGSLDTSFNPGANITVGAVAVQADGQILVGGYFTTLGGGGTGTTTRNRIGRLNADGSLDTSFNPGADNPVFAVAVQADWQIVVGGFFTTLGGGGAGTTTRNYIGRLRSGAPTVTANPTSTAVVPGRMVTFTAAATGVPTPTAHWQVSTNGGSAWSDVRGATSTTYSFTAAASNDDQQFRAVFTNARGMAVTMAATLFVRDRVSVRTDLDGDGLGDLVVWRPGNGYWYSLTSSTELGYAAAGAQQWGSQAAGDVPLMDDIDGDGKADLIVWRASTGTWYWLTSSSGYSYAMAGSKQFGNQSLGDVPMLADIDGDGRADLIVWRATTGTWYWLTSSSDYSYALSGSKQWGSQMMGDVPKMGDIDGDGKADLLVWRAPSGMWHWLTSSSGYSYAMAGSLQWGSQSAGDQPLVGDIDGDGKSDFVVWRAPVGIWYWVTSSTGYTYGTAGSKQWGNQGNGDVPLLTDPDGDGKADLTVWRAPTGTWYWLTSVSGYNYAFAGSKQWGSQSHGDVPMSQ